MRDSPAEQQDVQYVTEQQKLIKHEDMELLTDPDNEVVLVPNFNVSDLQVIPDVEPEGIQSSAGDVHKDFVSVMDSASALDHYEEVNALMEEVIFDSWKVDNQECPASWHDGFSKLLQELNGRLVEDNLAYPMGQGDLELNPYELCHLIMDKANYIQIEDSAWTLKDDRCHTTDPDPAGRMNHLRRTDADARGLTPTIVEDEQMTTEGMPELLPVRAQVVIGPEAHLS
eukprot:6205627-Amphidinium_carterae.1